MTYCITSLKISEFKKLTRQVLDSMTGHISWPKILQKIMQACILSGNSVFSVSVKKKGVQHELLAGALY